MFRTILYLDDFLCFIFIHILFSQDSFWCWLLLLDYCLMPVNFVLRSTKIKWCIVSCSFYISTLQLLISLHYFSCIFFSATADAICYAMRRCVVDFFYSCNTVVVLLFRSYVTIDLIGKNIRFVMFLDFPFLSVLRICCHDFITYIHTITHSPDSLTTFYLIFTVPFLWTTRGLN